MEVLIKYDHKIIGFQVGSYQQDLTPRLDAKTWRQDLTPRLDAETWCQDLRNAWVARQGVSKSVLPTQSFYPRPGYGPKLVFGLVYEVNVDKNEQF